MLTHTLYLSDYSRQLVSVGSSLHLQKQIEQVMRHSQACIMKAYSSRQNSCLAVANFTLAVAVSQNGLYYVNMSDHHIMSVISVIN